MLKETVVFALTSSTDLARSVAEKLGLPLGRIKVEHFADGEILVTPQETVRGRSVFIIQSTCTPVTEHLMEVLVCIDACKRASAKEINVVIPYYGYRGIGEVKGNDIILSFYDGGILVLTDKNVNVFDAQEHDVFLSGFAANEWYNPATRSWEDIANCPAAKLTDDGLNVHFTLASQYIFR